MGKCEKKWGDRWGSNPRQPEPQSGALPTELRSPAVSAMQSILKKAFCQADGW